MSNSCKFQSTEVCLPIDTDRTDYYVPFLLTYQKGVGESSCELLTASQVAPNSCLSAFSCVGISEMFGTPIGFSTRTPPIENGGSCQGEFSCAAVYQDMTIGAESCQGTNACRRSKAETVSSGWLKMLDWNDAGSHHLPSKF